MLHFPTRPISVDALPCENGNTVITPLPSSVALVVVNSVGGVWIEWVGVSSIVGHVEAGFTFLSSADGVSCLLDRVCAQDGDRRLVAMSQRVERAQRSLGLAYTHTHTSHQLTCRTTQSCCIPTAASFEAYAPSGCHTPRGAWTTL